MHDACNCKQPFLDDTYDPLFAKEVRDASSFDISAYATKDAVRRFLHSWENEVDSFRESRNITTNDDNEVATQPCR